MTMMIVIVVIMHIIMIMVIMRIMMVTIMVMMIDYSFDGFDDSCYDNHNENQQGFYWLPYRGIKKHFF